MQPPAPIISIISVDFFRCKFVRINIPTSKSFCGAWWHIKPHQVIKKIVKGKMEEYVAILEQIARLF